uniref:Uncharacterized protein n=1 Tax=Kalanchoe fedtschenkoi TaxID=63787 RepID=A0A7N0TR49_KALFE
MNSSTRNCPLSLTSSRKEAPSKHPSVYLRPGLSTIIHSNYNLTHPTLTGEIGQTCYEDSTWRWPLRSCWP